ncbi:MAG: terminase large subunit [Ruminococcus sp.]|nr:terminase large subunit [Ruminococcus sp.]
MTIRQELTRYAADCASGARISCRKHKWACQRFLSDMDRFENEPDYPYYWDEDEAKAIVKWFSYLRHSKGVLAGKPIELLTAQKFTLCQLYGWRRKSDGLRRFTKYFKEVARKNAKSQELGGVALYEISRGSTKNAEHYEGYCAGTKRDQSKLIPNECKLMLKRSPLARKFNTTAGKVTHRKTGSFLVALSKQDGQNGDGTNPALLILDEYHQHQTTEFYDLALGSNTKEPLLLIITTAGKDLNCPCYQQEYMYCSDVLDPDKPDIVNDEYLIDIYEADPDITLSDETYSQLVEMANPVRASYAAGRKLIRNDYVIAKEIPEKMISFMTKILNVWVQARHNGYMNMAKWNRCRVDELPVSLRGLPVYVGFDMSAKIDLTSVSFVIPFKDKDGVVKYIVFSHSFIPNREKLLERCRIDKMPYDAWERNGWLTVTDTEIVDQNAVMNYVKGFVSSQGLVMQSLCFDPQNAGKLMLELSEKGYDVVEVYQSHKSLNESTAGFREQVYSMNVIFINNPLLNYAIGNAVVRTSNGLIKIDKDATKRRVDPVDATLCAFKLALYHVFDAPSADVDKWLENESW